MTPVIAQARLILRNDLRLFWREVRAGKLKAFSHVGFMVLIGLVLHAFALLHFLSARGHPPLGLEAMVWLIFAIMMLGTSMSLAIGLLFERADFDLLLPSPVAPNAILLARSAALTIGAGASVALFLLPLLNGAGIGLDRRYFCGYLVWGVLASVAASAGIALTLRLVGWIGARRARTWIQVGAALFGAVIYFAIQGPNLVPRSSRAGVRDTINRVFEQPVLTLPAQAGRGEPWSLLLLLVLAGLFAWLTHRLLGRLFVSGVQEAAAIKTSSRAVGHYTFADGLARATFAKDARLIVRDPLLLTKILPTTLYFLPVVFTVGRLGKAGISGFLAPLAALVMLLLSTNLVIVAVAGEEGWDLIRMSGASTVRLRIAKIAAALTLPFAICGALALVIAFLGRPGLAAFTLFISALSASAMCWLEVATIKPTPRQDIIQRKVMGSTNGGRLVAGAILGLGSVAALGLAGAGMWLVAAVAAGILALLALTCFVLVTPRDPEFADA